MKTKLKKQLYKLLITILVAVAIVMSFRLGLFNPHHRLAQKADNLYRIVDIELPDALCTEQYDNLDRTASSFDCFDCITTFKDTLSESTIAKLDQLCKENNHWEKTESPQNEYIYCYTKEGWLYNIVCLIYNDHAKVEYSIDELEGAYLFLSLLALLVIVASVQILRLIILGIKAVMNYSPKSSRQ